MQSTLAVREHASTSQTVARLWLRRLVLALVPLVIVYEIAMNVFLATGALGRVLSFDPETFTVRYASAWSILPGYVHAKGLYIRSKDGHVEFELRIDRCTFQTALLELPKRRFHATSVRGEGIVFRARQRLAPDQETARTIEALPPIEGLEPIPRLGVSSPPPDDAHYKLWSAELERVDARSIREIWVDQLRFIGDAHIVGAFLLQPIRWVTVGPASVTLRTGELRRGTDTVASPLTGNLDVTVDGFDPRALEGAMIFRFLNVRADLVAAMPSFDFVNAFADLPSSGPESLVHGSGSARCDLRVVRGRLSSPTHLEIVADPVALALERGSLTARLQARLEIMDVAGTDALDASVEGREMRMVERGFEGAPLTAEQVAARLHSQKLDLADHPFSDATLSASVPSIAIPDVRLVNVWLPHAPVRNLGGRGTCGGHLDIAEGVAHGNVLLGLDALRVAEQDGWSVTGNLRTQIALRSWNVAHGTMDVSGSHLDLADVSTTGGTAAWWARVDLASATVDLHPTPSLRARVSVAARDARPLASLFASKSSIPEWIVPLFSTDDLRASADVRASPSNTGVRDLVATAGGFRVEANWAKRGPSTHSLFMVALGPLAVAVEGRDSDTHLQLIGAEGWYREHVAAAGAGR